MHEHVRAYLATRLEHFEERLTLICRPCLGRAVLLSKASSCKHFKLPLPKAAQHEQHRLERQGVQALRPACWQRKYRAWGGLCKSFDKARCHLA
jgi:hypothetical protein